MKQRALARPRAGWQQLWWGSLPIRVLASTVLASFIVLVMAGLLLLNQSTAAIVESKKQSSITEASGIYGFMQQQLRSPESRNIAISEQLARLANQAEAQAGQYRVAIQGPASVLVSGGVDWESVPESLRDQVARGEGMYITATEVIYTDGSPSEPGWVVGSTLVDTDGERFPVYYIFPMSAEVQTLRFLQQAVVTAGLVLLGALSLIATLVTMQVVRPVRRASQTARRLASGNLDERMAVRGTDDIATLAVSMNEMADDLQQRIRELEALSLVQRRFVSDVSHELRTPMTTIKMASDLLFEQREDLVPQSRRTTELMSAEIERFDNLLNDLLEISRFDAGAVVLDLEEVDLAAIVQSEVDNQRPLADRLDTPLRFSSMGDAVAMVDARRIRRILRNLIINAIEHGESQRIDVLVRGDEEAVAVSVRDRGVGFEASQSTQVFERFWRADASRTRFLGGSGLGLSIALEDARLHRGWLTAWGRPGRGAQFRLTIPKDPTIVLTSSPLPVMPLDESERRLTQ